jgi:hypothetical protein
MPHVASGGTVAELLRRALDDDALGVRTLARRIADETGDNMESWRSQLHRILKGQEPERQTAITIARSLRLPDDYLLPEHQPDLTARLAEAEAEIAFLQEWVARAFESLGVAPELQAEARRVVDANGG